MGVGFGREGCEVARGLAGGDALTELRKPLVSKLATESRRMARDVTTEFVRNNARMLSMIMEKE